MIHENYPYKLPELLFPYNALEPYITEETMHYHYDKHFKGYIDKLNAALAPYPALQRRSLIWLLKNPNAIPREVRDSVMKNAGGVYNHYMYFHGLSPAGSGAHLPTGEYLKLIEKTWGSFDGFKTAFNAKAMEVFGSGWTVLKKTSRGKLEIINLPNQRVDLRSNTKPLVYVDVWEHAYYLQYKNLRQDYLNNIWNVIDFSKKQ